ncbi:surface protein-like isoform X1 [Thunnus albacares]|uniref:surface protein-like isoform X1 n=2 Tax=Thunnus albacares TaxID=8236 RepID=UPI001CF7173F|nr:surface protein-like isoform X1 [Thunnus albacares]XP_044204706.1 surface protein-like isoform X1 [Thunnus albacares]
MFYEELQTTSTPPTVKMEQRGDGSHNRGNRRQFLPQFIPSGDFSPANHVRAGILAWLEFLEDLGILDGGFGAGLNVLQHQHAADNHDNVGNNNVENNVGNGDNNVAVEDAGMEDNQDIPEEDPLPGGSRRRSREEDEDIEERSSKRFRWWDEFADSDSDSDDDVDCTGMNLVQDPGADMEVNQHVREEDSLPNGSTKRSREDDEEEDERGSPKSRRCDEFADSSYDCWSRHDYSDSSGSGDLSEDAVEEEDPLPGGSRKRSREEDADEDGRAGKLLRR